MAEHWLGNAESLRVLTCCDDILLALKIPAWTVVLGKEKADEDCAAEVSMIPGRQVKLQVDANWDKYEDQQKMSVLLHEMLHVTLFDAEEAFNDFFVVSMASSQAAMWRAIKQTQHENITSLFEKILWALVDFNYPTRGTGKLVWEQGDRLLRQAP